MSDVRFSQVSQPRQALIRLCQTLNHGSIEGLKVEHSEPVFDPAPVVLKHLKLDSDDEPRPELVLADFAVSREIVSLIRCLDEMKLGAIRRIEVRCGIPRLIVIQS